MANTAWDVLCCKCCAVSAGVPRSDRLGHVKRDLELLSFQKPVDVFRGLKRHQVETPFIILAYFAEFL